MTRRSRLSLTARLWILAAASVLLCLTGPLAGNPARAATPAPAWSITSNSYPTAFTPGTTFTSAGEYFMLVATNIGGAASSGPITVTDTLPDGVTLDPAGANGYDNSTAYSGNSNGHPVPCTSAGQVVTCTVPSPVEPGSTVGAEIAVDVAATVTGSITNRFSVAGGGGAAATGTQVTPIGSTPPFGFTDGAAGLDGSITNADGTTDTQAGSHPYQLTLNMGFNTEFVPNAADHTHPSGHPRDILTDLPRGLVVNPNATPVRCTEAQLETDVTTEVGCPAASQVGVILTMTSIGGQFDMGPTPVPLYNMVPPRGVPAEFGFDAVDYGVYEHLMGGVQTGAGYGLTATANDISARVPLAGVQVTFWGDPSDPSHNLMRQMCTLSFAPLACPSGGYSVPASTTPFLTMPSACSGPLSFDVSADSWENPGSFVSDSFQTHDVSGQLAGVTDCSRLSFDPSITVQPDSSAADSPSGLHVDLQVPQHDGTNTLATANLKQAVVTLPAGMSVNPSAANGLTGCSPGEIGMDNANEPSCPDSSKVGSVEVDTPLLPDPMTGGIYIAQQDSNPFGSLLAIYVTAEADGALIKLAGHIVADPVTGQLTTTFDNNPQLPFSDFKLDFWGGPQAVLATPQQCGTYSTSSGLSPWSGTPAVTSSDSFNITSGCVTGFAPTMTAGTQNPQAGAYTPFVLSMSRSDADQNFQGMSVKLPPGMLANLSQVSECSGAQLAQAAASTGIQEQADPSCPANSQVGTVTAGSGVGPDPFFLGGKVYLTGPYKGAPYGLAIVVPALAGPYDLGTVVVRQALDINPDNAQVTDVSDNFPTILQGIPLDIRRVDVDLNRPDFTINPTSCDVMAITGTATSTLGINAPVSSRFQVGGCAALKFAPKLVMKLTGKGRTKSGDHPNLIATYTVPSGDANTSQVRAALPLSLALDPNNSQVVCPYATAQAVTTGPANCPADTKVGTATAYTPLLSQPLSGPVYLVQGLSFKNGVTTHTLPTLLVTLRGQIALNLRAQTSVSHGKLVSTFSGIPDAAVSKFTLQISGGKHGILVITGRGRSICGKKQITDTTLTAQSGKTTSPNIKMSTPCRVSQHKTKRHRKHK